ncbi:MAG: FtsK/SpoIIIE domain-containing protein [Micrococcales bacterium]|nr:FtsK/SpoIIIE domain-containing protein [Micrococcales bacterium]
MRENDDGTDVLASLVLAPVVVTVAAAGLALRVLVWSLRRPVRLARLTGLAVVAWVLVTGRAWWLAVAVALLVVVVVVWWRRWPVSFDYRVTQRARGRVRSWSYRRRWGTAMTGCGLTGKDDDGERVYPARSVIWSTKTADRFRVRMLPGQTLADWNTKAPALAAALDVQTLRFAPATGRFARKADVDVTAIRCDPLAGTREAVPAADGLAVRVGRCEDGSDLVVDLADPWHVGVQGMSRSGKSVLLYDLLAATAGRTDVLLTGLDPTGILLAPWAHAPGADLRHSGTADLDHAVEVVEALVALMDQRIGHLLATGLDQVSPGTPGVPVVVVVLEEYPGLVSVLAAHDQATKPAGRLEHRVRLGVRRLVQEGAKAGIRVVMLAQRFDAAVVGGAERSNLGTRLSMRVDNGDAVRMLHPAATPAQVAELAAAEPGRGLVDTPGQPTRWFKADLTGYGQYADTVRTAHQHRPVPVVPDDETAPMEVAA